MTSYYAEIKKGVSKRKVTQNISGSYFSTSCNYVIENLISKNVIQFDSIMFLFLPSKNFAASFKREDEKK